MTSENEDGLALKKRKMDETEMENEYDSDSSKDSEHHQQLLSERAEEAEMKFDDAKLRIVNLMAQKTLSIRELASIMSFASQAFDNIYKDIEQGKYKEVAGGEL
jgi:signal transduction protein with GAF and PtsI domain